MKRGQTDLGERTRELLAEHGIQITEEGVARARQRLREAEEQATPADWQRLREFVDAATL